MIKAVLHEDFVLVPNQKEASQIHNKGYFGVPQSGGSLKLSYLEAVYLADTGRIHTYRGKRKNDLESLIKTAMDKEDTFELRYIVYRDLRQRGYITAPDPSDMTFAVLPRGGSPKKTPSKVWVHIFSERSDFDLPQLMMLVEKAKKAKNSAYIAIVDEEGDITYYYIREKNPKGDQEMITFKNKMTGVFFKDRVLIFDREEAEALNGAEFFGKPIGEVLHLSLIEAAHLSRRSMLSVKDGKTAKIMPGDLLEKRAKTRQPDFDLRIGIYNDLKKRGLIVKTGFKYGAHFRAYSSGPDEDHATLLIHSLLPDHSTTWPDISRIVRLAHGVRKETIFGVLHPHGIVKYYGMMRVRP